MDQPPAESPPPDWARPKGVSSGTWAYINQRSIADHYDQFVADTPLCVLDDQIIRQTFPKLPQHSSGSSEVILDLGCGTGRTAVPLANLGYQVIGIDLSYSMLRQLVQKSAESESLGNLIQPVRANLVELDCFSDEAVDHAVCMFSTLGMIAGRSNRRSMLRHTARIVRPSGKLVLHVHNRWAAIHEPGGIKALVRSWFQSKVQSNCEFGDAVYSYRGLEKMFMHRYSKGGLVADLQSTCWQIETLHRVALDGSTITKAKTGGFIVVARKPEN